MSEVEKNKIHKVVIGLGSNISPTENLPQALSLLERSITLVNISSTWKSQPVGTQGPDFLNAAVLALTPLSAEELKNQILRPVEASLGRERTSDPNAPRTIDLDILIFDGEIIDADLWEYAHTCVPVAEILPDYLHPLTGEPLNQYATRCLISGIIEKSNLELHRGSTSRNII